MDWEYGPAKAGTPIAVAQKASADAYSFISSAVLGIDSIADLRQAPSVTVATKLPGSQHGLQVRGGRSGIGAEAVYEVAPSLQQGRAVELEASSHGACRDR